MICTASTLLVSNDKYWFDWCRIYIPKKNKQPKVNKYLNIFITNLPIITMGTEVE